MADETPKPIDEDIRHDDLEYNPALEPQSSKAWLHLLEESETAFEDWNLRCDKIDEQYASLKRLASYGRDREFQMFWANMEVLKPSIYAKAPVPVVVPKFKDRRPVYQSASEVMERCASVAFDQAYINDLMLQVRDDVALISRGVAWVRYESGKGNSYYDHEKVCIDFKHRRDFLHSISRCWYEVAWVAAASYLTRAEARARFYKHSGNCYQDAEYKVDKESKEVGGADDRERAKFWEIWHRGERRVVWVAQGCEDILDEAEPHLDLPGFFPCPKPAYGTLQRGSLVPVPDSLQYQDQLDEVNSLTGRIHALSQALVVKGFYPAGGGEISDAVQKAISLQSASEILVPIANWAAFGGTKDVLIWLPIDMISEVITALVAIRKQIIDDIYQIMGLSDIMRGATDAQETLGAQQLKTQYGSVRIRDKQYELTRMARDLVHLTCEIIAEKFDGVTVIEMSQTQLPTRQVQQEAVGQLHQQIMALQMQMQQQPPPAPQQPGMPVEQDPQQQVQMQMQQLQGEIEKTMNKPTIEQVLLFLRNNRMRSFVLDIETDSTIFIDEQNEKQQRGEFMQMLANLLPQLMQMIAAEPKAGEFCGEVLKFAVAPYRAGRSLDGAIDQLVELAKAKGDAPRGDDPTTATNKTAIQIEGMKQQTQKEKNQTDMQLRAAELQLNDKHKTAELQSRMQIEMAKLQGKQGDDAAKVQQTNQKMMSEREKHQMSMVAEQAKMQADARKMQMAEQAAQARQGDMAARQQERQAAQAFKQSQPQRPPGGGP